MKVCGITSLEDALVAAEAGADALGLNFFPQSPRYVSPRQGRDIVWELRERFGERSPRVVGVFVNAGDTVYEIAAEARLDAVQLHGDERAADVSAMIRGGRMTAPVLRAFRCRGANLADVAAYLNECGACGDGAGEEKLPAAVLLDAYQPGAYGGTGQVVDWDCVRRERHLLRDLPVILAGGLTAENVARAIAAAHPHGVDAASGVESAPGKKDPEKVRQFVAAAKEAFAQLGR